MSFMFQARSCPFFLYDTFSKIINGQLQKLDFEHINGVLLSFQCCTKECIRSVSIEIDTAANIPKLSVSNPETNSVEMIFDFHGRER